MSRNDIHISDRLFWPACIGCWALAVIAFQAWTLNYSLATLRPAANFARSVWPAESALKKSSDRLTLIFFIHPRCSCTWASLHELENILAAESPACHPDILVLASCPASASADWAASDLVVASSELPNATVHLDTHGNQTALFGAVASGTVMVFTPDGRRLFAGGVTASRGHEGRSTGGDIVASILKKRNITAERPFPAFGCRLCLPGTTTKPEDTRNRVSNTGNGALPESPATGEYEDRAEGFPALPHNPAIRP